jgi:hypothetical protein
VDQVSAALNVTEPVEQWVFPKLTSSVNDPLTLRLLNWAVKFFTM